ncbi:MAG TPA: aminoacyl-tRNA hydrolase [Candidatus Tectomicrobia bacterium]|nr:aminoacyl-tRNA hydrolase [Candidatus Tectomicrobia bacterium]
MKLIVGLGNPGPRYEATRHNVGFQVIDTLAAAHHIVVRRRLSTAEYGEGTIAAQRVVLAKPMTHMNASGRAVAGLCAHFSIQPNDLIVVHDDLDLHLSRVKLKLKGGDAGHYGVRSIIEYLGTGEFVRIRVGIGRPASKAEIVEFVLSPFMPAELPLVDEAIRHAVETIENLLSSV